MTAGDERRQEADRSVQRRLSRVAEALTGADDEQLDARPAPGKWTAREVVHHLADSEMTAAIRLRLLLAIDNPPIHGYDQDEFAKRLFYDRPIAASLDAFKAARRTTAEILEPHDRRGLAARQARTPNTRAATRRSAGCEIYAAARAPARRADPRRARRREEEGVAGAPTERTRRTGSSSSLWPRRSCRATRRSARGRRASFLRCG